MQCDAMRCDACLVGLRARQYNNTPGSNSRSWMSEPDAQTDRQKDSWAAACQLTNGVRVQQGAPVADALIRANAVDVLQEGKKKTSRSD